MRACVRARVRAVRRASCVCCVWCRFQDSGDLDAKVKSRLDKKAALRVAKAADRQLINLTTLPVVVVCTKMDVFQEQATNKRKARCVCG